MTLLAMFYFFWPKHPGLRPENSSNLFTDCLYIWVIWKEVFNKFYSSCWDL